MRLIALPIILALAAACQYTPNPGDSVDPGNGNDPDNGYGDDDPDNGDSSYPMHYIGCVTSLVNGSEHIQMNWAPERKFDLPSYDWKFYSIPWELEQTGITNNQLGGEYCTPLDIVVQEPGERIYGGGFLQVNSKWTFIVEMVQAGSSDPDLDGDVRARAFVVDVQTGDKTWCVATHASVRKEGTDSDKAGAFICSP